MTNAAEEAEPSARRKGEVEEQDLAFAPPSYAGPDPEARGRWRMLGDDGVVWTDDAEGAGVMWLTRTETATALYRHFSTAKSAGLGATSAYELAVARAAGEAGPELSGRLQEALDDLRDLRDDEE